jgi:hypothetical protein
MKFLKPLKVDNSIRTAKHHTEILSSKYTRFTHPKNSYTKREIYIYMVFNDYSIWRYLLVKGCQKKPK